MGSNRLILATSTDEAYMSRAQTYFDTIDAHSQIENYCLTIDFDLPCFQKIGFQRVNSDQFKLPLNNKCVQHGEFCDFIPGDPDDVILFTDADLRMQRPFSEAELERLRNLKMGQFYVGYNAGPQDRLEDEAGRLGLKMPPGALMEMWGPLHYSCFNWGCVAATRETWQRICAIYVRLFPVVDQYLTHVAKQQWLLSWIVSEYFVHQEMPTSFHAHNHYGIPEGCEFRDGLVYSKGELALFAHKFDRD